MPRSPVALLLALLLAGPALAQPQMDDQGWIRLEALNLTIEVPAAFVSYDEAPIETADPRGGTVVRYAPGLDLVSFTLASLEASGRPQDHVAVELKETLRSDITYTVDERDLGVASGYVQGFIFYDACKRRNDRFACFSLTYPERYRALIDPLISRILRSLR